MDFKKNITLKKWLKRNFKEILLCFVLVVSFINIFFSLYILRNSQKSEIIKINPVTENITDSGFLKTKNSETQEKTAQTKKEHPYAIKHEIYRKYKDGEWKTYTNDEPLTEEDIQKIRNEFTERQKAMDEYFRKQQKLMNEMWNSFPW